MNRARPTAAYVDTFGRGTQLQPNLWSSKAAYTTATGGNSLTDFLGANSTTGGSGTNAAGTIATTNFRTRLTRLSASTLATSGDAKAIRFNRNALNFHLSAAGAGIGGFCIVMRVGIEVGQTGSRAIFGLQTLTTAQPMTSDTSSLLNMIAFGWDAADTQLQFMVNDGTGTATKTAITASAFAKSGSGVAGAMWELALYAPSNGGQSVNWYARELSTGAEQSGVAVTDLPANDTMLCGHLALGNGTTAAIATMAVQSIYHETDN